MNRRPYPHPDVTRLLDVGRPNGPSLDEALALFQRIRRSPHEARALEELTFRQSALPLPEPLTVAAASAMLDRGEPAAALGMLRDATSASALMLRADIEAERGDVSAALALMERVLLRNIEHPGARERHQRFRESLGIAAFGTERTRQEDPRATTWLASEPDTPYVLHREVARGGSGVVYEAEDRDLGRRIALKIYHDPNRQRDQLVHEARVASSLAGPGIVRVFDIDPDHGWIALTWAARGALRDRIRAVDRDILLPVESWALPLAHTLARVHEAGWLHLDVKPANVLFDDQGAPLLTDFGIARRNGEPSVAGSLGYVSPERLAGAPSTPGDDVYGFGRLIEDALQALNTPELFARWRPLVAACMAPRDERLASAKALAQAMAELKAN